MSDQDLTYEVQPNDSLSSISLKFRVTVAWIKLLNPNLDSNIHPGQSIIIMKPEILDECITIKNIKVFPAEANDKGILRCDKVSLRYLPDSSYGKPLVINLLGHLESAIMPHPTFMLTPGFTDPFADNALSLFVISYITDFNTNKFETISFEGLRGDLLKLHHNLLLKAEAAQSAKQFVVPDINSAAAQRRNRTISDLTPEMNAHRNATNKKRNKLRQINVVGSNKILTLQEMEEIRLCLPYQYINAGWKLLFQLSNDGSSYLSFFEKTRNIQPVVLLILTDKKEKIGAYISKGLKVQRNFYGNGETFVFKYHPTFSYYRWTNANQYFVSSSKDEIAIGGGGASALWVDSCFISAISEPCPTFNSPALTSVPHFKIVDCEVWQLSEHI